MERIQSLGPVFHFRAPSVRPRPSLPIRREGGGPKCHVDCREREIAFRVSTGLGGCGSPFVATVFNEWKRPGEQNVVSHPLPFPQ